MNQSELNIMQKAQRLTIWNSTKLYFSSARTGQRNWTVARGEVYFANLGENIGSEENKIRPVLVIQADSYNFRAPVFICAIISSSPLTIPDIQVPITNHYPYTNRDGNTAVITGTIDLGQIRTIAKERIVSRKVCQLGPEMKIVDEKLLNVFGLRHQLTARDNTISSLYGKVSYLKKLLDSKQK